MEWVISLPQCSRFSFCLQLRHLTVMCLGTRLFMFILLADGWVYFTCVLMFYNEFITFLPLFLQIYFLLHFSLLSSHILFNLLLSWMMSHISLRHCSYFFIFSLCFSILIFQLIHLYVHWFFLLPLQIYYWFHLAIFYFGHCTFPH